MCLSFEKKKRPKKNCGIMLWCYFYFQLALLWQRFTKMKIVLSLNFKTDLSQATIVLQWTLHLKWSVQHCAWMFLANIFIIMIVRNVWFGQGEGINSAVIIMWTTKNVNRKMSLTLQVLRQLIGPNGLILCKILNMMSQLATWCHS